LAANLVIAWHLLTDNCDYGDLGDDYFVRRDTDRQRQQMSPSCKPSATRSPSNPSLPNTRGFMFQDEVRRAESLRLVTAWPMVSLGRMVRGCWDAALRGVTLVSRSGRSGLLFPRNRMG